MADSLCVVMADTMKWSNVNFVYNAGSDAVDEDSAKVKLKKKKDYVKRMAVVANKEERMQQIES